MAEELNADSTQIDRGEESPSMTFEVPSTDEGNALAQEGDETEVTSGFALESSEEEVTTEDLADGAGRIAGKVFDEDTGSPVRGVAILIEGTTTATITDSEGRYRLNNIPEGSYSLSFVKTGYIEATITDTGVVDGELTKLDFALPPRPAEMSDEVYELQDFTVTAQQVASQNVALLALRQQSIASIDALSSEDFAKFAASDVAEAVSKISGASLSDGKYVVIRGLNDRYNTTLINGVRLPSPDPDRKAVALDIFPTSLFEAVVARKTYTSDMPGESSGGSIEMRTKSVPEEPFVKFSFSAGGQETSSNTDTFYEDPEQISLGDWLEGGNDNRGYSFVPGTSEFVNDYPTNVGGVSFPRMTPEVGKLSPFGDRSYSLSLGGSTQINETLTIGGIFGARVSEKRRSSYKELYKIGFEEGRAVLDQSALEADGNGVFKSEEEYGFSMLAGLGLKISDHSSIDYAYLRTESLTSTVEQTKYQVFEQSSPEIPAGVLEEGVALEDDTFYGYLDTEIGSEERLLEAHQFSGEHAFDLLFDDWSFSWYFTKAKMEQSEPDQRAIAEYLFDYDTFVTTPGLPPISRYQRDTEQDSRMYGLRLGQEIELVDGVTLEFDLGYDNEGSERSFQQLDTVIALFDEIDDVTYAPMPFPNVLGVDDADADKYSEDFFGVDQLVLELFELQIEGEQSAVDDASALLPGRLAALGTAEDNFNILQANFDDGVAQWEAFTTLDFETQYDPSDANQLLAYQFFIESSEEALNDVDMITGLTPAQEVAAAQEDVDETLAEVAEATVGLDEITTERDEYLAESIALINQIATMPALATDPTAFPTFSFFGDENYILETPLGFS
ncbi:MAG: carboxypeptidase regulatory-like domain-containing protein, partial [Verrucomicrobiota bacterium]